jgi:hypothetical protein
MGSLVGTVREPAFHVGGSAKQRASFAPHPLDEPLPVTVNKKTGKLNLYSVPVPSLKSCALSCFVRRSLSVAGRRSDGPVTRTTDQTTRLNENAVPKVKKNARNAKLKNIFAAPGQLCVCEINSEFSRSSFFKAEASVEHHEAHHKYSPSRAPLVYLNRQTKINGDVRNSSFYPCDLITWR